MLRTGWPLLALLSLPPVVGYLWRGITYGDWGWGIAGLLMCSGSISIVWHGFLGRTIQCSGRVYHRCQRPVRYWLTLTVVFILYILFVVAFFVPHSPHNGPILR